MAAPDQSRRMSDEEVLAFWREQARQHGTSHAASWSDTWAIELEIQELTARLEDGDRVLDIGCANGFSTLRLATARRISVRGVDYAEEMVDEARRALEPVAPRLESDVEFAVGDITDLSDEPTDGYDKAVVTRVVINVGEWSRQEQALREAIRVVRPGGTLLLSEACVQGWRNLNRLRGEWGLPEIPMPSFNNYLDAEKVVEALADEAELAEICHFSSTYFVGTRVLKPLLAQAAGAPVDVANPDADWNRWFAALPAAGDYGTQMLLVFRKRER